MSKKQFVEKITSMEDDFAQWYTDVVTKARLVDYSSSHTVLKFGRIFATNLIVKSKKRVTRMSICRSLSQKAFSSKKRIISKALLLKWRG